MYAEGVQDQSEVGEPRLPESVLNQAEVGEEQNDPNRIDYATIFELDDVRGVGGSLETAGDI